jgi:hypothetical protein
VRAVLALTLVLCACSGRPSRTSKQFQEDVTKEIEERRLRLEACGAAMPPGSGQATIKVDLDVSDQPWIEVDVGTTGKDPAELMELRRCVREALWAMELDPRDANHARGEWTLTFTPR